MKLKNSILFILLLFCVNILGCSAVEKINRELSVPQDDFDKIIQENVEPISMDPNFGGKVFCDYMEIDSDKEGDTIKLYLYLWTQEYYMKDNVLTFGSGARIPAVVTVNVDGDNYTFADCNISTEEETNDSIKIFPEDVREKALRMEGTFKTDSAKTSEERAREYFHIKPDDEINKY